MKLQLNVLQVAFNTLYASLRIADRGEVFQYTRESRESAMKAIQLFLDSLDVEITPVQPVSEIEDQAG